MSPLLFLWALGVAPCPTACEDLLVPPEDVEPVPPGHATEPDIVVSSTWLGLQLIPNPALALGEHGAHLRLSWQLTPILYSFSMDPRLSAWRSFVVEPIVRHSGSIELVLSPEYVGWPQRFRERFGYRVALRSTFGLIQRGDYLSLSLGTGFLNLSEGQSVEYEAGLYIFFGSLGVSLQYAPGLEHTVLSSTLRLRYF